MLRPTDVAVRALDLGAQRQRLGGRVEEAVARVLDHGQFILGPEVFELEERLAEFCGCKEVISCSSGTDALLLSLMAQGVGPGQAVFVPGFTFAATAGAVALAGATPVLVDVDDCDFNLSSVSLAEAVGVSRAHGLIPTGVIAVDLFGQPANYPAITEVAAANQLWVLADAAQSFGARSMNGAVGTMAGSTATSFFPSKPLGGYGDGGAVFTDDAALAATMRQLRVHGLDLDGTSTRVGINGRLDTIQAAVLIEKLEIFPEEVRARQRIAATYSEELVDLVQVPLVREGSTSVWAQYTVQVDHRDEVASRLRARGISSTIYYPKALHHHPAYGNSPVAPNGLTASERVAARVLSLPLHPYLTEDEVARTVREVRDAVAAAIDHQSLAASQAVQ